MNEYIKLGIYENGNVIVGRRNNDALLPDCVLDVALIKNISGEPLGSIGF